MEQDTLWGIALLAYMAVAFWIYLSRDETTSIQKSLYPGNPEIEQKEKGNLALGALITFGFFWLLFAWYNKVSLAVALITLVIGLGLGWGGLCLKSKPYIRSRKMRIGTNIDLEDEVNSDTFYGQVENQIALRGHSDELLAVQGTDQEYCKMLFKAWLAADKAEEDPKVVAAFTLTSLEYYDKNRDVALSYLKRLESGWNAMVAYPYLAAQVKQNAVEAQQLEDKTDAYQVALSRAEKRSLAFLSDNAVCENFSDPGTQEKLYAWLLVYLATYKAWKDSNTDIHQNHWNTFQRRIEVEMLGVKDYGHVNSRVISTPEDGKAFAHFSSNYWAKMDELANVVRSKGVDGLVTSLLYEMDSSFELEEAFISFFNSLSRDAERSLVKMIANFA